MSRLNGNLKGLLAVSVVLVSVTLSWANLSAKADVNAAAIVRTHGVAKSAEAMARDNREKVLLVRDALRRIESKLDAALEVK